MSKSNPLIGPRNAGQAERRAHDIKDYLESQNVALITAGMSIAIALVGKKLFGTETVQAGSIKKGLQSFAVISVAGISAAMIADKLETKFD